MSFLNIPYFTLGSRAATRQRRAAAERRLACPCGGIKDNEKNIVCLACFQSAPLDTQRCAYSRFPEVRRVALRELLKHAASRNPKTPNARPQTQPPAAR